jgi:hypothetical protein
MLVAASSTLGASLPSLPFTLYLELSSFLLFSSITFFHSFFAAAAAFFF